MNAADAELEAAVDAMARFLATCLCIKDIDDEAAAIEDWRPQSVLAKRIRAARPTLGELLYEELQQLPSSSVMKAFEALGNTYEFASEAIMLAHELARADPGSDNIVLTPFVKCAPYYQFEEHERGNGSPALTLGDFGRKLRNDVKERAGAWLEELDRHLCSCHGTPWTESEAMNKLIAEFANALAKRHTLMHPESAVGLAVDPLTPRYLELRAGMEYTRNTFEAEARARVDLEALRDLLTIATHGARTEESRRVLATRAAHLAHVVSKPPSELAPSLMRGEHAKRMDTDLLRKLVRPETPQEVKHELANRWADNHGAYARCCISEAIQRLQSWSPEGHAGFIRVLRQLSEREVAQLLAEPEDESLLGMQLVPPTTWVVAPVHFRIVGQARRPTLRTGLDNDGERIVRFTSAVWQMLAAGAFEEGVVERSAVAAVAVEVHQHASLLQLRIEQQVQQNSGGTELMRALEHAYDGESVISGTVTCAVAELRAFSLKRIYDVFNSRSPLLRSVLPELARRTRALLVHELPKEYTEFVTDALAIFLPVVEHRRRRLNLHTTDRPNPLGELLRTVPHVEVRARTSRESTLVFDGADLKSGHPALRSTLESLARQSSVVRAAHLSKKNGHPINRPVRFWIDREHVAALIGL